MIEDRRIKGKSTLYVAQSALAPPTMHAVPHRHDFYEIAWFEYGAGRFICDFEEYDMQAGALIFVSPGQVHTWRATTDYNLILIGFRPTLFARNWIDPAILSTLPYFNLSAQPYLPLPIERQQIFHYLFTTIYNRYMELGVFVEDFIELSDEYEHILLGYLHLILIEAERLYSENVTDNKSTTAARQLTVEFQAKVELTYTQRRKIQDYSSELGVTPNYLAEVIRKTTNKSPREHVQQRLLLEAQRLLAFTDSTIAEIAAQLSFSTSTHFGQWFKNQCKQSPGQFRQQFR